jgi:hypothetical protein
MRRKIILQVGLIGVIGFGRSSYGQFFGLGRDATAAPVATMETRENPTCGMPGCSPRSTTYGFYYESWRRWPEDLSKISTVPKLSPFVIPDRSLPESDVPDAVDETSVTPRKRQPIPQPTPQTSTEVPPPSESPPTTAPKSEETPATDADDATRDSLEGILPNEELEQPSTTPAPNTDSDSLFNNLEDTNSDNPIPPSRDDDFNIDDLQGSRLRRRRDYTYARRPNRPMKRLLEQIEVERPTRVADSNVSKTVAPATESAPTASDEDASIARTEPSRPRNPLRKASVPKSPNPVLHAIYETKRTDGEVTKVPTKLASADESPSEKRSVNPLRGR